MQDTIRLLQPGKVFFSKKYLPFEYFDVSLGKEYSHEDVHLADFQDLRNLAGEGFEIWVYYDTGFSLYAIQLDNQEALSGFITQAERELYASIRFFAKSCQSTENSPVL